MVEETKAVETVDYIKVKPRNKIQKMLAPEIGDEISTSIITTIFATFILLLIVYPLWFIIINSFSSGRAVAAGEVYFWPVEITLDGYKAVLDHHLIIPSFKNSIMYMLVGTTINVVMTVITAYPLSRKDLIGRSKITLFFAFTVWFNGGMIPTFLLYRSLGMINTFWVMVIPGAVAMGNMVITRTYFQKTIPEELLEAAKIDGASDIEYLLKIALPLAKPILAVITLYYAVGHWNQFFAALLYINDPDKYPIQLVLRDILFQGETAFGGDAGSLSLEDMAILENLQQILKYSVIVVSALPMMIIYPFVQKYFVRGIMSGSVKG
ncbi:carbohydrate ABC transporter permease [Candidatus Epulonipiscium viviparus]|uniref:carbohydrate ABC transporter permease n=1 Tax=Candidatus Epulonipiscium viviparus TaxID=420336 RepID=UPI00016C0305|nr:carbohydrate ABC transporter permease [Candidatus Epulopiscium viviparus]